MEICIDSKQDQQKSFLFHNFTKLKYCENMNEICKKIQNVKIETNKIACQLNLTNGPFYAKEILKPTNLPATNFKTKSYEIKKNAISFGTYSISSSFRYRWSV